MLLKIKKLVIINEGYRRKIYFDNMYINPSTIVSVENYNGVKSFLFSENSEFANNKYSLLKFSEGQSIQEVIIPGTAEEFYTRQSKTESKKRILND